MEPKSTSEQKEKHLPQSLRGQRFYRPGVIAIYCILMGLPVGIFLYGLNVARRESRVLGYLLVGVAGAAFLASFLQAAVVTAIPLRFQMHILTLFVGLGLFKLEEGAYRLALARGGMPARSWPPLLWVLGSVLTVAIIATLFGA